MKKIIFTLMFVTSFNVLATAEQSSPTGCVVNIPQNIYESFEAKGEALVKALNKKGYSVKVNASDSTALSQGDLIFGNIESNLYNNDCTVSYSIDYITGTKISPQSFFLARAEASGKYSCQKAIINEIAKNNNMYACNSDGQRFTPVQVGEKTCLTRASGNDSAFEDLVESSNCKVNKAIANSL